jgi:hypothetical protein
MGQELNPAADDIAQTPAGMKLVYDPVAMRPACVILQSAYGCSRPNLAHHFAAEDWLLSPTDDMRVLPVTGGQLEMLVEMTRDARIARSQTYKSAE